MTPWLRIGQLAQATGVPAKTIRYYEQVGVLPVPRRSDAGYRQYTQRDTHRLLFIRRARALGLSLHHIKRLTAVLDSDSSGAIRPQLLDLVQTQLHTVQRQIADFQLLERQLTQILQRLGTAAPANNSDGCGCLDIDNPEGQAPLQHLSPLTTKGEAMRTSALEPLTILAPSPFTRESPSDNGICGCGCGCGLPLTQLSPPPGVPERTGDEEREPPQQP